MNNEQLAILAKSGNSQAILELWERVKLLLYRMANRFYRQYGTNFCAIRGVTMDDLEQECFFAMLDAVRAFKANREFKFTTYLTRASENRFKAITGIKRTDPLNMSDSLNAPISSDETDIEAGDFIPDLNAAAELEQTDERYTAQVLTQAICRILSPIQIAVVRCRFYQQFTRPQTAQRLGLTAGDVIKEEHKALRALRQDIEVQKVMYQ